MKVSIITVNYKTKNKLLKNIQSIKKSNFTSHEIIVVDNEGDSSLERDLKKEFKDVKYIKSNKNLGFGAGNNLGARYAKGEYLFFLNPDTIVLPKTINYLFNYFKNNKNVGIVSPLLVNKKLEPFKTQSRQELTPKSIIFSFSILRKFFPKKNIYNDEFLKNWNKKNPLKVETVPGAALMIPKKIFEKVNGFDESFFLYFEENDLSRRIRKLKLNLYIEPRAKVIHEVGQSTKKIENIDTIFKNSRKYYLQKHFGFTKSFLTELFLSINKSTIFISLIFLVGLLLRIYKLDTLSPFIGDQGWFFMSAKNLLVNHQIPLVGIASSHPWLHQGPLWTYIVSISFLLTNFNPVSPFYFTSIMDAFVIILIYKICKEIFSNKTAVFASIIYALSPYAILSSRMAYHTALIPFFIALVIYSIIKWINGDKKHFPLSIMYLSILYNFELQTSVIIVLFLLILLFGFLKKKTWFLNILNFKTITLSIFAFLIPMLPVLIYDFNNGFPQTIVFAGWMAYKASTFLSNVIFDREFGSLGEFSKFLSYFYIFFNKLIFIINGITSSILIVLSFVYLCIKIIYDYFHKNISTSYIILLLVLFFLFGGIFISKTQSGAYLMSLFVPVIIALSVFFSFISKRKLFFIFSFFIVLYLSIINIFYLILGDYNYGPDLKNRIEVAKYMVDQAGNRDFSIFAIGPGSQFDSFTANYKFLTWYFRNEAKNRGEITYILYESPLGIKIIKRN